VEYVIQPEALFLLQDAFEKLGSLRPQAPMAQVLARTVPEDGDARSAARPRGPCLWVVRGIASGRRFPLAPARREGWVLGRDDRCDIKVFDPYASNRHAEVALERDVFSLVDLRSTNGTLHNWARLPRGGSVPLVHGDFVGIGRTTLVFWGPPRD
jgi:hypothetical protein